MQILLLAQRKSDFPLLTEDPQDLDSELLSEHEEDELLSGLRDAGHAVTVLRSIEEVFRRRAHWRARADLVIQRAPGLRGTERTLVAPALLEYLGLPCLGSSPYVHALVRNKAHTKLVAAHAGVPTPPFAVYDGQSPCDLSSLGWPAIVKPLAESSSIGIDATHSVTTDPAEALRRAGTLVERYRQPALIETFVRGVEVEVPILVDGAAMALGTVALTFEGVVVEGDRYLSAEDVYDDAYGFAAPPPGVDLERVQSIAVDAARALGIRDYGRVDLRVAEDGTPYLIEANTLPHLQPHSSFQALARNRGLRYHEMLGEIVDAALRRCGRGAP